MTTSKTLSCALFLCAGSLASAATHYVNNGSVAGNCPGQYSTIQGAVNISASGDTITVCNGIYPEQVIIGTSSLTINGQTGATIEPPNVVVNATDPYNGPTAAIVYVNGATNVTLSGLIIDGSKNNLAGCAPEFYGIYYSNSSGTLNHDTVRYVELSGNLFGCQTGLAINADNPSGASLALTIENSSVHDFQKNGITVSDTGLTATVTGNTVAGSGPTDQIGQNGIQIGYGAAGTVSSNNVSNVIYSPCITVADCLASATGILIYDSTNLTITGNTIEATQGAIYAFSDQTPATLSETVTSNKISGTLVFDGVAVYGDGSKINNNTIVNSGESAVNILGNSNTVSSNTVIESPVGVLISFGTGTVVTAEKNYDVPMGTVTEPPSPALFKAHQPRH